MGGPYFPGTSKTFWMW
jgi:hypothetical protein